MRRRKERDVRLRLFAFTDISQSPARPSDCVSERETVGPSYLQSLLRCLREVSKALERYARRPKPKGSGGKNRQMWTRWGLTACLQHPTRCFTLLCSPSRLLELPAPLTTPVSLLLPLRRLIANSVSPCFSQDWGCITTTSRVCRLSPSALARDEVNCVEELWLTLSRAGLAINGVPAEDRLKWMR